MHSASRVVAAALLAGCAGSPSSEPVTRTETQTIAIAGRDGPLEGQAGLMTITRYDASATDSLAVPAVRAFAAVRAAYEAIGIPVAVADAAGGQVGNPKFVVRQTLGRTALSRYLRCGETMTGSRADSDRIVMSIVTTVAPLPSGSSSIRTTLSARAIDMSGSSGDPQTCTSTGLLEAGVNGRAKTLASAR